MKRKIITSISLLITLLGCQKEDDLLNTKSEPKSTSTANSSFGSNPCYPSMLDVSYAKDVYELTIDNEPSCDADFRGRCGVKSDKIVRVVWSTGSVIQAPGPNMASHVKIELRLPSGGGKGTRILVRPQAVVNRTDRCDSGYGPITRCATFIMPSNLEPGMHTIIVTALDGNLTYDNSNPVTSIAGLIDVGTDYLVDPAE